ELEGEDDLHHAVDHGPQPNGEDGGDEGQVGPGGEPEGEQRLDDAVGQHQAPVGQEVPGGDGPGGGHDAAEQHPPADHQRQDEQCRPGPREHADADADLEQSDGNGPAPHRPVHGQAHRGEHTPEDEEQTDKGDELADGPVGEQDDAAGDDADNAGQQQDPPAAGHGVDGFPG